MPKISHKQQLAELTFLRIWHILGDPKRGIEPILPIGRTTFLNRVKSGEYPQGIKLSTRTTVWKSEDIRDLAKRIAGEKV